MVSPLPQTSAPRFLFKPRSPTWACLHHTFIDQTKVEQTLSSQHSGFQPLLELPRLPLPSSLSLSPPCPEEKRFPLPPGHQFSLNLSFKVCPRCPSVPHHLSLVGLGWPHLILVCYHQNQLRQPQPEHGASPELCPSRGRAEPWPCFSTPSF